MRYWASTSSPGVQKGRLAKDLFPKPGILKDNPQRGIRKESCSLIVHVGSHLSDLLLEPATLVRDLPL